MEMRGRGICRRPNPLIVEPNKWKSIKIPTVKYIYKAILQMNIKQIRQNLKIVSADTNNREIIGKSIMKIALEDDLFSINILRLSKTFENKLFDLFGGRKMLFNELQKKYEEEIEKKEKTGATIRNLACLLVFVIMTSETIPLYRFLRQPIFTLFNNLINSHDVYNMDTFAILYLHSWKNLKSGSLDLFENFIADMRNAILFCRYPDIECTMLFLIDITQNTGKLSQPLSNFYLNNLNKITIDKLYNWSDDDNIKEIFASAPSVKCANELLAKMNLDDEEENLKDEKQTFDNQLDTVNNSEPIVPRAIRGTGATD